MSRFRISRRSVLRGAGSIAIALPWLELMHDERAAKAAAEPARRFLAVYTPGGTVHSDANNVDQWTPTGSDTDFVLSPILKPLEPVQDKLIVLSHLDMNSAIGEQSQAGMVAWLTGTHQASVDGVLGYATGPSLDQVLARTISANKDRASVQMAVRWGTGRAHGLPSPMNIVNFADDASFTPVAPQIDPLAIWTTLFGSLTPGTTPNWDKSILDYVDRRYTALATRIGSADKQRIEEHLSRIRDLEKSLPALAASRCAAPAQIDTAGYDPNAGKDHQSDDGSNLDLASDAAIPAVGKFMMDMMVMAFACERTAVGTLMWGDSEASFTLPWLNLGETLGEYENHAGYQPTQLQQIDTWFCSQHCYLLQQMAAVDMGFHSLLDESVVFFGSEVSHPATHMKKDMPFLLAGGGGGLQGGRWLNYAPTPALGGPRSHNDLLVSIFNLFGDPRTTFGDPAYCAGPLKELTEPV
jgi:hypothetical protein